jgi:serralysin
MFGGGGRQAEAATTPVAPGEKTLAAAARTGGGSLAATPIEQPGADLIAGSAATTQALSIGSAVSAYVDPQSDQDWFRITLAAGESCTFRLTGGSDAGLLYDPYLRLFNANGALLTSNDDSGGTLNSKIAFTSASGGTYYIAAGAYQDDAGDNLGQYTLAVEPGTSNAVVYNIGQIADFLEEGYWGGPIPHFSSHVITYDLAGLTAPAQSLCRLALRTWQEVCDVKFIETAAGGANITFDDAQSGAFTSSIGTENVAVNIGSNWIAAYGTAIDSYTFQSFIHEIGHALGLGHAGPYNGRATYGIENVYANDSWQYSVMSYFPQGDYGAGSSRFVMTPQLADIAAVTDIYGAAQATRIDDTVYGFNSNAGEPFSFADYRAAPALTIYDSGGVDTLDCSGYDDDQTLSLLPGTFSSVGGLVANIAMAGGCVIENAVGGAGADTISGNGRANILRGNAGDDMLTGYGGDDRLIGGAGDDVYIVDSAGDRVIERADEGATDLVAAKVDYVLTAGAAVETLRTTSHHGVAAIDLTGNRLGQTIIGNDGANMIDGGGGSDTLQGLGGNDIYIVDSAGDVVIEKAGGGDADLIGTRVDYIMNGATRVEVLRTTSNHGGAAIDLTGNGFAQTVMGNDGSNRLDGAGGRDILVGLGGADVFVFSTAPGFGNVDTIRDFSVADDMIGLDHAVFTALSEGALTATAFFVGTAAQDADDRIIYNAATGALGYDADGSGAGGALQFAALKAGLTLTPHDFVVV